MSVCLLSLVYIFLLLCFFFFQQKTAYELRISDWILDVCSSDLLGHRDAGLDRRVEIDMVGTDTSSERELELGRLGDALGRQIGGPEGLRDYYLSVGQLLLQHRNGAVLARGDDQRMALR